MAALVTLSAQAAGPRAARLFRRPGLAIGGAIFLGYVIVALFAASIAPHDPYSGGLVQRLRPPVWEARGSWSNPLGTDSFGRDYLSRLIFGARLALAVGVGTAAISAVIGTGLGLCAGYFGGWTDRVVSYVIATRLALPALLVAVAVLQVAGSGLAVVIAVLGFTQWDRFAVVLRTATRQVRRQDYITRARTVGASDLRILAREVLPNVLGPLIVVFTVEMAQAILNAAALSFLGLGIQAPEPAWGLMMAEGRNWMGTAPWLITIAGLALIGLVLAVNLLGDSLRGLLTPTGRAD